MSQLEEKLRALARNGELTYLSMIPVAGLGEYGCTFVAQVTPASRFGHVEGRDSDPIKALVNALDALPKTFVKDRPQRKVAAEVTPFEKTRHATEPWDIVS